jgi:quercetin dioxygenase-like cupin family protein
MHTPTRFFALLGFLFATVALSDGATPPSTEDGQVAHLKDAKWAPPKAPGFPPGALTSPIAVDPQSKASVGYAKFAPGYALPSHWHSFTEYTVVISGAPRFTVDGKAQDLAAGDMIVIPAKAHHALNCTGTAECVVITRRAGPTDYTWDAK